MGSEPAPDPALPRYGPPTRGWTGELVLVRHAQTGCTLDGTFCGAHDPPLTATGRLMAERLAGAPQLAGAEALLCSPSIRSLDSCQPIAERLSLQPAVEPRLRELDFGRWEQRHPRELAGDAGYAGWLSDPAGSRPPGGERGQDVLVRTAAVAREALAGASKVVLVTHKAPVRLLLCLLLGWPARQYRAVRPVAVASISRLSFEAGRAELLDLGNVDHLPAEWRAAPDLAVAQLR